MGQYLPAPPASKVVQLGDERGLAIAEYGFGVCWCGAVRVGSAGIVRSVNGVTWIKELRDEYPCRDGHSGPE